MRAKSVAARMALAAADFQKLIRLRHADRDGMCECISCGKRVHWQACDGGHFIHGKTAVRFNEMNVHPQCKSCNQYDNNGRAKHQYQEAMIKKYGKKAVAKLNALSLTDRAYSIEELADLREKWIDEKYAILKQRRGY